MKKIINGIVNAMLKHSSVGYVDGSWVGIGRCCM
jgi:hypothetical protein